MNAWPGLRAGFPGQPMSMVGTPPDAVAWTALLVAAVLVLARKPLASWAVRATSRNWPLPALAAVSSLLSVGYFLSYLGAAPRIIDASTYLLEARTFATGHFSFAVPEPSTLFRGRFLLAVFGSPDRLAPLFPPGYPSLLALASLLGDYRVLGPLLAAGQTLSIAWLAAEVTGRRNVAILAALLGTLSAALRYHTADTMSHGLSILLVCAAAALCCRMIRRPATAATALALGGLLGWLVATRPLTGALVSAGLLAPLVFRARLTAASLVALAVGGLPGLGLLLAQQWAVTGSPFGSLQLAYYALADAPADCFGLGLGKGCHYEHGDVVAEQGGDGLTLPWALKNLLFRLHWHSLDVANAEPLCLLGLVWLYRARHEPTVSCLFPTLLLLPLGSAGFYFQGSYPGGGARLISELIPLLVVSIAAAGVQWNQVLLTVVTSLAGFALHGVFLHRALPPAPPAVLGPRSVDGVPTVATDHAFNLLFDPEALARTGRPNVVRARADARQLSPSHTPAPLVFEAEFDWPVLAQRGVSSHPDHAPDPCLSRGQGLKISRTDPESTGPAELTLTLTGVPQGHYQLTGRFWAADSGCVDVPLGSLQLPTHFVLTEVELGPQFRNRWTLLDRVTAIPVTNEPPIKKKR